MSAEDFVNWLKGYISALDEYSIVDMKYIERISDMLARVKSRGDEV